MADGADSSSRRSRYILLFDTGILEAYRSASISFPFTETLSGLQFGNGFSGLVGAAS